MYKIVEFSHYLINDYINKYPNGQLQFIDATCGNGNDLIFMAQSLANRGTVIGYDIQPKALDKTKKLIEEKKITNAILKLASHEVLAEKKPDLILYNLGYLPNENKKITTMAASTINSLKSAIDKFNNNANLLIIIVVYPGHEEGQKESKQILDLLKTLATNEFLVTRFENYNRLNSPYLLTITKIIKS